MTQQATQESFKSPPGFESSIIAAGTPIAIWERSGFEPALVFIHGNSASKAAFRPLLREQSLAGRRIVAMDLPGSGESANASDAYYTIPAFARTLLQVLEVREILGPIVLGWSLGGHAAIEAVSLKSDAIRALVLTGTPPCGPGAAELAGVFHESELMQVALCEAPTDQLLNAYVRALYGASRVIPAELFEAAQRCDGRMRRAFAEHWMRGEEGRPQRQVIAEWPNPIAVIQGDLEPFFDPTRLDELSWRNRWRNSTHYVNGTGHAPFFEAPTRYGLILAEFLKDIGA